VEPEIVSTSGEDFQDLVFALTARSRLPDGSQVLDLAGRRDGNRVALQVRLGATWSPGRIGKLDLVSYSGVVTLCSRGTESDDFLRQLDALYSTGLRPTKMAPATTFAAISLKGNPAALDGGPVKMKLFFESNDESRYAEVFMNIDAAESRVHLDEKDESYRKPLVSALAGIGR
jgi:hypothetical protein